MDSMVSTSIIDELVRIGKSQAEILGADDAGIDNLRSTATEVVINRKNLDCLREGLITEEEFIDLILAHFQTRICHDASIPEPRVVPDYQHLKVQIGLLSQKNTINE